MERKSRQIVVETARKLFMEKGKDGVGMQEIADSAGVNKGLLHYYFKSKNNLFKEIFVDQFNSIYGTINDILQAETSLDEKLAAIIDRYFDVLLNQPKLPSFVLFELNKHPEMAGELAASMDLQKTIYLLNEAFVQNRITSNPQFAFQVLLNIISLCVFPFMMKNIVQEVNKLDEHIWQSMMQERKLFLKSIIIGSLKL